MKKIDIENKIFLAPLAGYTDQAFRKIAFKLGADIAYGEMISAKAMMYNDRKTIDMLRIASNEPIVGIQLFGSDESILEAATKTLDFDERVSIIDLNLGCPAPKIVKNGEGSALLKDPKKIYNCLTAMRKSTNKSLSAKIRVGIEDSNNYLEVARIVEESGVDFLIVHGRTREQYYSGKADWEKIGEIKAKLKIPVIGNGDIFNGEDGKNAIDLYKVDGLMIGRGAIGNPWIFREIKDYYNGIESKPLTVDERFNIMFEHIELSCELKGERIAIPEMRKHLHAYLKGLKNSASLRNDINQIKEKDKLFELLNNYKQELLTSLQ